MLMNKAYIHATVAKQTHYKHTSADIWCPLQGFANLVTKQWDLHQLLLVLIVLIKLRT
jgi:hypothetical protein